MFWQLAMASSMRPELMASSVVRKYSRSVVCVINQVSSSAPAWLAERVLKSILEQLAETFRLFCFTGADNGQAAPLRGKAGLCYALDILRRDRLNQSDHGIDV